MFQGWEDCEVWAPLGFNFPIFLSLVKFFVRHVRNDKGFLTGEERLKQWTSAQLALAVDEPGKSGEESLLRQLLEVKTKEHVSLPIDEIAEEILDNFFAAQSVVTNALTFLLWDLACHPGWQSKVRRELQSLPAQGDGLPSFADIDAASILDACLRESSRIHPLSSGRAERVVPTTKAYDQVIVPAGGARVCLGIPFALVQMKLLIAFLLLEFEFHEDKTSATNVWSMRQLGTQSALPQGLRCDLFVRLVNGRSKREEKS
ncbi:MAG: hypothetical protein L6R42_000062 [Xanthoria sp. 1 TBL-2021]|nr:MAG: hypothetical protein L6R42_000062 [Xanthoria sp. 1 TBL-2021]